MYPLNLDNISLEKLDCDFTQKSLDLAKDNDLLAELQEFTTVSVYEDDYEQLHADIDLSNLLRFLNKKQGNINNLLEQLKRVKKREFYNHKDNFTFMSSKECKFDGLNMFKTRVKLPVYDLNEHHSFAKIKDWFVKILLQNEKYINCYSDKDNLQEYQTYKYLIGSWEHDLNNAERNFIEKYNDHVYIFDVQVIQDYEKNVIIVDYIHSREDFPF